MESKIISFIDEVYVNFLIYRALIVYPDGSDINKLVRKLINRDYPICMVTPENENTLDSLSDKYRMFAVTDSLFKTFLTPDVNLIICLSKVSYVQILEQMKEKDMNEDNRYIFSFDIL